jgi:hypothetical protein
MRNPRNTSIAATPPSLDKKLLAYLTAIGAACAGSVAAPQSAEAKVVYTPANRVIEFNGKSILDLNNDHIADFVFNGGGLGNNGAVWVRPFNSNNHVFTGTLGSYWAAALPAGATVGPGPDFTGHKAAMEADCFCSGYWDYTGPWLNAQDLYLGLEITINGQHHFGWARITTNANNEFVLTGYAYETIPGKAIVTGATSDEQADAALPQRPDNTSAFVGMPSLGLLARGAAALDLWRRQETLQ